MECSDNVHVDNSRAGEVAAGAAAGLTTGAACAGFVIFGPAGPIACYLGWMEAFEAMGATRDFKEGVELGDAAALLLPGVGSKPTRGVSRGIAAGLKKGLRKGFPCSSFTAATAVVLCDGTSKPISEIEEGDLVLTRNEDNGELSCWPVVSPYSSPNRALIDVELIDEHDNVEVLETTFDHPFYVLGQGWVRVEHLEVGDIVPTSNGQATVVGLAWKGQLATVYNFGVEQTRSYFVGETGAWVHNCWKDPAEIRFSQDSISKNFSTGQSVDDTIDDLASGAIDASDFPPIRVVEIDGNLFTLDNRRLHVFKEASKKIGKPVEIKVEVLEEVPANEWKKFTTNNQGQSIRVRR